MYFYPRRDVISFRAMPLLLALLWPAFCQAAPEAPPAAPKFLPPRPKNTAGDRQLQSSITALDKAADVVKVTLKEGALTVALKSTTELVQEERGVSASDLKAEDNLSAIVLKGSKKKFYIEQKAIVTSTNPLTLKIGDLATLTVAQADKLEFNRYIPIKPDALAVGQTVAVEMRLQTDGEIIMKRLAVIVEKPKPPRAPRRARPRKAKPPQETPALAAPRN
ncbi:MAG: hypothetical protein M3347_02945 [Armatimonadota bacterium]|nr:hypothetical protein [Armatimonadota bacterium]